MKRVIIVCLTVIMLLSINTVQASAALVDVFEPSDPNGYPAWNSPANVSALNTWLAAIGEIPDFGEDWDGNNWLGNPWVNEQLFDIQNVPGAIFVDGVTFGNIGAQSSKRAKSENNPGGTDAIDKYAWQAHESGLATVNMSQNGADYISFYIFDTDHDGYDVIYTLKFSDGSIFNYNGLRTPQNRYRFVGFVNRNPAAKFVKLEISAEDASRYGIDELKWGRSTVVPEPTTLSYFLLSGSLGFLRLRRKKIS